MPFLASKSRVLSLPGFGRDSVGKFDYAENYSESDFQVSLEMLKQHDASTGPVL
jgi:hypothetical protein